MNNLPPQFAINNLVNNQRTAFLVQIILSCVRQRGGSVVENQIDSITFEYTTAIDDLEHKKITAIFQQRKSSYRLSLFSKVQTQGIAGGTSTLLKMIESFNRTLVLQNNIYYFTSPSTFLVRSIIEKDSIQILELGQLQLFFKKLFDNTSSQFILRLSEISGAKYEQQYYSTGTKEIVGLINMYKGDLANQVSRRNNKKLNQNSFIINNYYGLNPVLKTVEDNENEEKRDKLNSYLRRIKSQKSQTAKQIQDTSKLLAHKIIMMKEKVDKNWKAPESSYGSLERVQAEYITVHSFNEVVNQQIQKQNKKKCQQSQKLSRSVLVRKKFKKQKCSSCTKQINQQCQCFARLRSYETQIAVVSCIRNVVTENIASYFLEVSENEQTKVQKFYSKYYPKCLSTEKLKAKQVLPLILNIIQGMKILDNLSILHRDLKPDNILLDAKMIPKIIDFGSAWIINRTFLNEASINLNKQLYTTKKYNLYFEDAFFGDRDKMTQYEFQQHKLYDMHAFGVIVKQIISDSQFTSELGSQILKNLFWLSWKCSLHNPNQRLNHLEVQNFCSLLLKLWQLKSQCFNK